MRLVRYRAGDRPRSDEEPAAWTASRLGLIQAGWVIPTSYSDTLDFIRAGESARLGADRAVVSSGASRLPLEEVTLLAPLHRPGKIFGSGINYASHTQENPSAVMPAEPGYFAKHPSSVIGPGEPIVLPYPQCQADYEVELAVVIGRRARGISRDVALDYVFGYTVVNDVSARNVQFKQPREQWITHGKGFDTFCPMGPVIVTADEVPDPSALRVRSYVNGELRQDSPTSDMLFPVQVLIEYWSQHVTLERVTCWLPGHRPAAAPSVIRRSGSGPAMR